MRPAAALVALVLAAAWPTAAAGVGPPALRIVHHPAWEHSPVVGAAVADVQVLLQRAFPGWGIGHGEGAAGVRILVLGRQDQGAESAAAASAASGLLRQTDQRYAWESRREDGGIVLRLSAASEEGVACGLYGLLTEKLGFAFHHPREMLVPEHRRWPLPERFRWTAAPRFATRGFHLHTQHPIELTEPLLDPLLPGALEEVREYVDWLARNGQNAFQFVLLRGVDRERWPAHAAAFTAYAHGRGIRVGVAVSLSMVQQRAFQLVKLLSWRDREEQARGSLAWLMQVPWDFVTLECALGEHLPDLCRALPSLRDEVVREVAERRGTPLLFTTHVIPPVQAPAGGTSAPGTGALVHTVMCYSLADERAPVYGNRDLRWAAVLAREESAGREAWYWPESSYWVGFDSSVPVLLLPYLTARWSDMNLVEELGLPGHLTFSSGWEWGYWLVDWSIARWSWRHEEEGRVREPRPLGPFQELLGSGGGASPLAGSVALQAEYLSGRGLLPYLATADPSAELAWPFDAPFQPRMSCPPRLLLESDDLAQVGRCLQGPVADLEEFARRQLELLAGIGSPGRAAGLSPDRSGAIREEIAVALEVTALRARHRALTLRAALARRGDATIPGDVGALLGKAALVRAAAQRLVERREGRYRYPVARIARRAAGHTSYGFGYLWPAGTLHFWRREEEQVRTGRFDAFFMNIWDFRRIVGISGLWR